MSGVLDLLRGLSSSLSALLTGTDTIRVVNSNICNLDIHDCVDKYNKDLTNFANLTGIDILDGMIELLVFQKKVRQPNIYALQEVDKDHKRTANRDVAHDIEEALEGGVFGGDLDGPFFKQYENIQRPWHVSDLGNALVSNHFLDRHFEWDLSDYSDSVPKRNAIGAYLYELSLPMWIITLHLSTSKEQALFQLKDLIFRLNNLHDNDLVLVVGDFNINDIPENNKLLEYNEMIRDFSCSGYEHLKGGGNDHVFLRDAQKKLTKKTVIRKDPIWEIDGENVRVSDHSMFVIDLSWPRRQVLSF
jgi:endonuclease/exonuclease/phosphatase family metal-dependent hydrolase